MLTVTQIAGIAHEAVREYNRVIADPVQPQWDEAPDWMRESAIDGVGSVLSGEVESPEDSHRNWLVGKAADGWTYGPVKDPEKKEHPCMVEYDQLPPAQRLKGWLFYGIVRALAAGLATEAARE